MTNYLYGIYRKDTSKCNLLISPTDLHFDLESETRENLLEKYKEFKNIYKEISDEAKTFPPCFAFNMKPHKMDKNFNLTFITIDVTDEDFGYVILKTLDEPLNAKMEQPISKDVTPPVIREYRILFYNFVDEKWYDLEDIHILDKPKVCKLNHLKKIYGLNLIMNIEESSEVWKAYTENVISIKRDESIDHVHLVNNIWVFRTNPEKHLCVVMAFEKDGFHRHLRLTKLSEAEIAKYKNDDTKWIHTVE